MKKSSQEAIDALVGKLDEQALNRAVGAIDLKHKKALIVSGLLVKNEPEARYVWWKNYESDE